MTGLRPPLNYYGGKTRLAPMLAGLLPAHRTYLEPFAGSAAVPLAKPPSPNALAFEDGRHWRLDGDSLAQATERAKETRAEVRATAGVGDRMAQVIAHVLKHPQGVTTAEVAIALDMAPNAAGHTSASRIVVWCASSAWDVISWLIRSHRRRPGPRLPGCSGCGPELRHQRARQWCRCRPSERGEPW